MNRDMKHEIEQKQAMERSVRGIDSELLIRTLDLYVDYLAIVKGEKYGAQIMRLAADLVIEVSNECSDEEGSDEEDWDVAE